MASALASGATGGANQAREFGLERILDGLEALIDRRAAR
nr:hypothetical protein [Streptomyces benahoarensis]